MCSPSACDAGGIVADSQIIPSTQQRRSSVEFNPLLTEREGSSFPVLTPSQPRSLAGLCSAGYLLVPSCFGHAIRESILPEMLSDFPPALHVELSTRIISVLWCFSKATFGPSTPQDV